MQLMQIKVNFLQKIKFNRNWFLNTKYIFCPYLGILLEQTITKQKDFFFYNLNQELFIQNKKKV